MIESAVLPPSKLLPSVVGTTSFCTRSEPVYSLEELVAGGRRYQVIVVNRNDRLAALYRDLGADTGVREFAWFANFDHSVGEVMDWAEEERAENFIPEPLREQLENSTLVEDLIEQAEQDIKIARNVSTFGHYGKTQRSGYSRKR